MDFENFHIVDHFIFFYFHCVYYIVFKVKVCWIGYVIFDYDFDFYRIDLI